MSADWQQRFAVAGRVGSGGEGTVFVAEDKRDGGKVALKIVPRDAHAEAQVALLASLRPHAGLAPLRCSIADGDRLVIVSDWVEGADLATVTRERAGVDQGEVLRWLADAAAALAHLHGHVPPIVHGDVKPANLVLTPAGRVVVIDLGGAAREGVARERVAGSRGFQAPESTQAAVTAGDVYGLAATAVVLLGGALGIGAAAAQLPGLAPPTARAVRRVLARGLSTDPARRQRSVRDLVAELGSALGERTGAAAVDGASAFVGRDEELGLVEEALSERRLVTLVGPGGCGKTRLASEAAALLERGFGGRTVNVGLVTARDEAQLIGVLAAAVGLREAGEAPLLDLVGDALARHAALMVLDNCEHVLEPARMVAATLLARCPRLSILATSRQALALDGERVLALAPLAVPAQPDGGARLARVASVRLFLDRARRTAPGFAPADAELEAIGRIVRRLDGIPLAVELAAAQLARSDLATIEDGLAHGLPGSLDEAIGWSHALLSPAQQATFRRCAVFVGGWPGAAAQRVLAGGLVDPAAVQQLLAELEERSLLVRTGPDRYSMLETVREYAARRLAGADDQDATAERHLSWIEGLAARSAGRFTPPPEEWLDDLDDDLPNVRQALATALAVDPRRALRLAEALQPLWLERSLAREGDTWLATSLERAPGAAPEERFWAVLARGLLLRQLSQMTVALELLTEHEEAIAAHGDPAVEAALALTLCGPLLNLGQHERAGPMVERALAYFRSVGDVDATCLAGHYLVWRHFYAQDYARLAAVGAEILPLLELVDRAPLSCHVPDVMALGVIYSDSGDVESARRLAEYGLRLALEKGTPHDVASAQTTTAEISALTGHPLAAAEGAMEVLPRGIRHGDVIMVANAGGLICGAAARLDRARAAAPLDAALRALYEARGLVDDYDRIPPYAHDAITAALTEDELRAADEAGRALSFEALTDGLLELGSALTNRAAADPYPYGQVILTAR